MVAPSVGYNKCLVRLDYNNTYIHESHGNPRVTEMGGNYPVTMCSILPSALSIFYIPALSFSGSPVA